MDMFKNKVVIVTGASAGIGQCTAVEYAKHGAKLVLAGRNEENLKKTAKACEEQGRSSDDILLVLGDLTNEDDCNRLVDSTIDKFGCLDVLVNNAGSMVYGNIEKSSIKDVEFMFSTHVRSVYMVTKRAMPHLKKTKGNVLNVSSAAAIVPGPSLTAYCMAKAAANQFTKCLAQDVGPSGVRVNCVLPGSVDTDIFIKKGGFIEGHPEQKAALLEQTAALYPFGRVATVQEVASTILYVTCDAASFITGVELPIDGGIIGSNNF